MSESYFPRWCSECGKRLEKFSPRQEYCSKECLNRAKRRRERIQSGYNYMVPRMPSVKICSRAQGRECAYWVPICSGSGSGSARFCAHLLITGHSNGWKDPCECFKPGEPIRRTTTVKYLGRGAKPADLALLEDYEADNVYKRG